MSLTYNDTTNKLGIIQAEETYCSLGDGGISGNTTLLKEFTRHNQVAINKIHSWIKEVDGGTFDDGNQTNLPSSSQQLTINVSNYALPSEAMFIYGIEIYDASGNPTRLVPTSMDQEQVNGSLGEFGRQVGVPSKYMLVGTTIKLDCKSDKTVENGFKVYYGRGPIGFTSTDTNATVGFTTLYDNAVAVGGSLEWLSINKPDSTVITKLQKDWDGNEDSTSRTGGYKKMIQDYYANQIKDASPIVLSSQITGYL